MSDDINKDIQKAISDAQNVKMNDNQKKEVTILPPKVLQHSLDVSSGITIPSPKTIIAEDTNKR